MSTKEGVRELAIYIHLPFCVRKCLYCDFNSGVYDREVQKSYVNKLCEEIDWTFEDRRKKNPGKEVITSIFFGGGTPSVLEPVFIERILCKLKENAELCKPSEEIELCKPHKQSELCKSEITIEVNPGTVEYSEPYEDLLAENKENNIEIKDQVIEYTEKTADSTKDESKEDNSPRKKNKLEYYKEIGINRISIGMQSGSDEELKTLGRIHNYEDFLKTYQMAKEAGFENISVDVMYALPGQTFSSFEKTLRKTAELSPPHISAYSLIVEEGTPFDDMDLDLPGEETERKMYVSVGKILKEYGYHQYEISNYAKDGFECRHNSVYWKRGEYLGFGLSAASLTYDESGFSSSSGKNENAHSACETDGSADKTDGTTKRIVMNYRYTNTGSMEEYLKAETFEQLKAFRKEEEHLSINDCMSEYAFLSLRMNRGISAAEFREFFGRDLEEVYGDVIRKNERWQLLTVSDEGTVSLTAKGRNVANVVMADFLLDEPLHQ